MQFSNPNEQGGSLMSPYARPSSGRRRFRGCLIGVLLALIVAGGGLGFWFWHTHGSVTLSVGTQPTISDSLACVRTLVVQAGPANQVTFTGDIPSYTQNSSTNTIEIGGDSCQNITIAVPPVANLDLWAAESITVHGVSGIMTLGSSNGGLIDLEQVTLEGNSKLDATYTGGTSIDTPGGPIVFNGSLAPGSSTTMEDSGATINVTLSPDTSCQLDISGDTSKFTSNIPGVQMLDPTSGLNANIGSTPTAAKLVLDVSETAIVLNKTP